MTSKVDKISKEKKMKNSQTSKAINESFDSLVQQLKYYGYSVLIRHYGNKTAIIWSTKSHCAHASFIDNSEDDLQRVCQRLKDTIYNCSHNITKKMKNSQTSRFDARLLNGVNLPSNWSEMPEADQSKWLSDNHPKVLGSFQYCEITYLKNVRTDKFGELDSWVGTAIVNGADYDGEFEIVENYEDEFGNTFEVDWTSQLK